MLNIVVSKNKDNYLLEAGALNLTKLCIMSSILDLNEMKNFKKKKSVKKFFRASENAENLKYKEFQSNNEF